MIDLEVYWYYSHANQTSPITKGVIYYGKGIQ